MNLQVTQFHHPSALLQNIQLQRMIVNMKKQAQLEKFVALTVTLLCLVVQNASNLSQETRRETIKYFNEILGSKEQTKNIDSKLTRCVDVKQRRSKSPLEQNMVLPITVYFCNLSILILLGFVP